MSERRQLNNVVGWLGIFLQILLLTECAVTKKRFTVKDSKDLKKFPPVQFYRQKDHVVVDNGLVKVTVSVPGGTVTGIEYNGIPNLLETRNKETNRGYWDVVWKFPDHSAFVEKLEGTSFDVITEEDSGVELSFTITYDNSINSPQLPLNIDKRFILLRGHNGFYTYAIFERLEGWPALDVSQTRAVFKLEEKLFQYMAISDKRQRIMPTLEDRERGKTLAYPEAVLLTNPANHSLKVEVDDKYQYSSDVKDTRVHGWICTNPPTGFWMIIPSNEFRIGGPMKQELTSQAGATTISSFHTNHYAGEDMRQQFRDGEPWKKVYGPVFVYLNSVPESGDPDSLWEDAKQQMLQETENWPYDFPRSEDYLSADQRGSVSGRLIVRDTGKNQDLKNGSLAYVGLALPGNAGSWQMENKGYQFWTQADNNGNFSIENVLPGNYSLYAWVPGCIGDYKYDSYIIISPRTRITLDNVIYEPPRNGPTLWEIGIPDRTAIEFFVPDPSPRFTNPLYLAYEKFRQYGLWDRYSEIYPDHDLVFTVGDSNYETDWFYAQVNRNIGNHTYIPTTWQIAFDLQNIDESATYTLQLALASSTGAALQVRINDPNARNPIFNKGLIGKDNAIARHGIHGLYRLYSIEVSGSQLVRGRNSIFLTQSRNSFPWEGIMYDYIRLEGPPQDN
ncbi:uncharacterized protein [Coffea arabica]|uniref:rhamnogalacturonan endolyase n=1 Tax=Coffea arabica TaxID=13443 RepID=A0ABM4V438_COFAR